MDFKRLAAVFFFLCLLGTSTSTTTGNCGQEFVFAPMPNHFEGGSIGVIIQACSVKSRVEIYVQVLTYSSGISVSPNSWPYDRSFSPWAASLIHSTISGPIKDSTIVIRSNEDISMLMYNVYTVSSDIYTVLPEKNLGDEHFVALISYDRASISGVISISSGNQASAIEIHLTSAVQFMSAMFYAGDLIRYTLLPYESIQLLPSYTSITGTRVLSNVSIAVSAGCKCAQVPEEAAACDYLAEQLAPFKAWGKQFVVSPFALRRSGYILQIVAGRDNTVIAFNNSDILELNMGRYHTVDITSQEMIFVSANKPISIMQYPKGVGTDGRDDPSMIRVTPNEQFVTDATFPVYKFPSSTSRVEVMYLGVTAECRYMDRVSLTKDDAQITPTLVEEYSTETYNGTQMCSRWSEIGHGSYSLSSQPVTLPNGQVVSPRFRAVVYGSSGTTGYDSYLYRAASNDRPLTCTRTSGSSTQEFDCPEYCSPTRIGNLSFPQGEVGVPVDSLETCPLETALGGQPVGRAVCMKNASFGPLWKVIKHIDCSPVRERGREQILQEILESEITEDTAERVIEETAAVSQSPDELTQTDVANIALIIKNITNLKIGEPKVTLLMTNIISNTADVNEEELYELESSMGTVTKILEAFEEQLKYVVVPEGETYTLSATNVAVQVTDVAPVNFSSGLNLTGEHFNFTSDPSVSNNALQQGDGTVLNSQLPFQAAIPSSVFDGLNNSATSDRQGVRVALAVFRTPSLFASRSLRQVNERETDFNRSANSLIVGLTVGDEQKANLKENIIFTFEPIKSGYQDPVCVFWDTDIPDWSTNGCQQITSQNEISDQTYDTMSKIICSCNHLTNFAVLMDIHAPKNPPVPVLRTLSFIGCSFSILSLVITLITYLSNKKLHAHQSQKIFLCLCATLFCLYITFIIMSALDTYPGMSHIPEVAAGPCGFLAALVHFFTISSLAWMGVEAFNTYLIVVRVFNSYIPHFMIRAGLVAWGASGFIVALTGAVARENYASSDYCFLQFWPLVGGLLIPIAIILFFNVIVFILVVRRLTRSANLAVVKADDTAASRKNTIERVKNAVGILTLLGLTWITGYFTLIESSTFIAQVLFIILNSLQGLFILVLYCLRNPMVRHYWWQMIPNACKRGTKEVRSVSYQSKTEKTASTSMASARYPSVSSDVDNPAYDHPSTSVTFSGEISKDQVN